MNALYIKRREGKLECLAAHPLPQEVETITEQLQTEIRYMVEFYANKCSPKDAEFRNTRLSKLPSDAVLAGSENGIVLAFPAPNC